MKNNYLLIGKTFATFLLLASCKLATLPNISATEPMVGVEISEDGFIKTENLLIPADTKTIYFQFNLDIPEEMEIILDFKWYIDEVLYYSYSGKNTRGNTTATLDRNPELLAKFPPGNYRVEVWFLNTLLTSKSFKVQD